MSVPTNDNDSNEQNLLENIMRFYLGSTDGGCSSRGKSLSRGVWRQVRPERFVRPPAAPNLQVRGAQNRPA